MIVCNPAIPPAVLPQYKMENPSIVKTGGQTYQIGTDGTKPLKAFAIIQKQAGVYKVATMIPADAKIINLSALGVIKQAGNQYWIIAIGKQNQISDYIPVP